LVTFNRKDFPVVAGSPLTILGPSAFLKELWKRDRAIIVGRLEEQADAIGSSMDLLLDKLAQSVPSFVELLRKRD
jgi:hypothetical protein